MTVAVMPRHPRSAPVRVVVEAAAVATAVAAVAVAETGAVAAVAAVIVVVAVAVTAVGAAGVKTAKAVATGPLRVTARVETPGTESDSRALTVAGRTRPQK